MLETLLVLPVILILGFGIVHAGLVFQAQSNLEYAALMAARVGASTSIDIAAMQVEVADRMSASQDPAEVLIPPQITVVNPTRAMFLACGESPTYDQSACAGSPLGSACEIPNFGLQLRDSTVSCDGGANIQDANILRIRVAYYFDSKVPFMDLITFPVGDAARDFDFPDEDNPPPGRWVYAVATVRMQSPARITANNADAFP